jgi:hypothetical protein
MVSDTLRYDMIMLVRPKEPTNRAGATHLVTTIVQGQP